MKAWLIVFFGFVSAVAWVLFHLRVTREPVPPTWRESIDVDYV